MVRKGIGGRSNRHNGGPEAAIVSTTPHIEPDVVPAAEPAPVTAAPARSRSQRAGDELWDLVRRAQRHRTTGLSSQFAYNAFIATVPLLLTLIAAVRLH